MALVDINGACHCGNITYSARVEPEKVRICHCNDCQRLSGSAFRVNLPVEAEHFKLLSGELRRYTKVAASGNHRLQCFCEHCGSQIYATSDDHKEPRVFNLRVGTIEQRALLAPRSEQWIESALPWVKAGLNMSHLAED